MSTRYDALTQLAAHGVDIVPLLDRSDAYVLAFADELGVLRMDEWDPDQPRDEHGMFASAGGGTVEGAVKSGMSAIGKTEDIGGLSKISESIKGSKVLTPSAKAKLYQELADKAGLGSNDAIDYQHQAFTEAIKGEKGKDWVNVEDPETGFEVQAMIVPDGNGGQAAQLESGENINMPGAASETPLTDQFLNGKPGDDALYAKAKEAEQVKAAVESAKSKPQSQLDHSKEAREAAKKITAHAKELRDQYKKNPTAANKAKLEAAEKAAKAARSAARKAEKSKSPEEAKKHAEKAKSHHAKLVGGDEEAHAFVVSKSGSKTTSEKSGGHKELASKAAKLKEQADAPHPSGWSAEKIAAKDAAKEALEKHANASTPEELKAAAKAFDNVAKQASAAGSLWGSSYSDLAEQYREKTTPQEKLAVGEAGSSDHSTPPSTSARPIHSIEGEQVSAGTHDKHRDEYTKVLTGAEKKAALRYSGSSYSEINANLRKGGAPSTHDLKLDKAISKAPAPKDMLVHRGLSGEFSKNMFANLKPGDQYVEKAYTSTSAGNSAAFGGSVALRITVPKGYPIAPIPSHHENEREYLLRRNTKYQVTKIEKSGNTVVAHVTVVHDGKEN